MTETDSVSNRDDREEDPMRVLVVHNRYRQPGGEDQVFEAEVALLRGAGHDVRTYTEHNDRVADMSRARAAAATIWNRTHRASFAALLARWRPDVVHAHNTFPLISPAIIHATEAAGIPFVQTLHNYRLVCPAALLYRDGEVCNDCVGTRASLPSLLHACYRGSRATTAATAAMLATHRLLGTWRRSVTTYVALTEFARSVFVRGGIPADRLQVKPNFLLDDPGRGSGSGGHVLFVGRLAPEKGVRVLLDAARSLAGRVQISIVGDGPLGDEVRASAAEIPGLSWLGRRPHDETLRLMGDAACLVFPSTWYEGLPMTIVEAFACGVPVVASDLGAMQTLVDDGVNGQRFAPGRPRELADALLRVTAERGQREALAAGARHTYLRRFTAARNLQLLENIYESSIARVGARTARTGAA
jgi:glycosyltransferase involved in cell wall biosynthesis